MKESAIERMNRDVRILRIYEGANEVQHMVIESERLKDWPATCLSNPTLRKAPRRSL